jgi:tight adherence protein C
MLATMTVFVLVAVFTAAVGYRMWDWRTGALGRLAARKPVPVTTPFSAAMAWRELVAKIGTNVPLAPRNMTLLKKRLVRAGFRSPHAVRQFQGIRGLAIAGLAGLALVAGLRMRMETSDLVLAVAVGLAAGYLLPGQILMVLVGRRKHAVERGLPNALDQMVVCVEAGLGLDQTTVQVARELQFAYPEICEEFAVMNLEMRAGKRRAEALHNLADRTGVEDLRKLVAVLVQTDRFGTSIAATLRGHADYMRVMARQRAEERAAKLAVKLVFPIFFCILPSLFVVTVGPVLTRLVRDLLPAIDKM